MEIERKFIVHNLPDNLDSYPHSEIEQGYLCMEPVIRIRRMNKQYFLTFKSKGLMARTEHEFPLDKACEKALKQIKEKHYDQKLEKEGYETILNYGIACYKKRCKVLVDK